MRSFFLLSLCLLCVWNEGFPQPGDDQGCPGSSHLGPVQTRAWTGLFDTKNIAS